jgi:cytochrome c oxidase assembly protein subunit 15
MTLSDFQRIYFWEHVHRQLGRFIGLAYLLPFGVFLALRLIPSSWIPRIAIGFALLLFQGFLGWFMVKSGLVDKPYVSHFRLAAHLSTALLLFAYLLWLVLDLLPFRTHRHTNYISAAPLRRLTTAFLVLLSLQIIYGAFTAGLRAGYMHNSYPLMSGRFFPADALPISIGHFFNNPAAVQFVHRHLGLLVVIAAFALWATALRQRLMVRQKFAFNLIVVTVSLQFILGIYTLISGMNIVIAVAHQICACFLLAATVTALHELIEPKTVTSLRS